MLLCQIHTFFSQRHFVRQNLIGLKMDFSSRLPNCVSLQPFWFYNIIEIGYLSLGRLQADKNR